MLSRPRGVQPSGGASLPGAGDGHSRKCPGHCSVSSGGICAHGAARGPTDWPGRGAEQVLGQHCQDAGWDLLGYTCTKGHRFQAFPPEGASWAPPRARRSGVTRPSPGHGGCGGRAVASATCDEPHSVTDRGVQGDPSHCPARSVSSVKTCSHLGPAPLGGTMLGDSRHNPSAGWSPTEGVCASTKEPASQATIPGTSITMGQRCPYDGRVGWHPGSGSPCVPPWEMAGDNWVLGPCHLQGGPG